MAHKNRHRLVGAEVTYLFWALPCRLGHLLLVSPRQGVTHRETGESFYNAVPCGCTQQARLDYAEIALLRTGVCVCARVFFSTMRSLFLLFVAPVCSHASMEPFIPFSCFACHFCHSFLYEAVFVLRGQLHPLSQSLFSWFGDLSRFDIRVWYHQAPSTPPHAKSSLFCLACR